MLPIVQLLAIVVALLANYPTSLDAAARTYTVPLRGEITEGVGRLGEPVISYYTQVGIGTPQKPFNVQFDTDFNDNFVPHYEWMPTKTDLHYKKGYSAQDSRTSKKIDTKYTIFYQQCNIQGKPYFDEIVVSLANMSPLQFNQGFIAAKSIDKSYFKDLPVDGFFGLGPDSKSAASRQYSSILTNLLDKKLIDNLQFSMWFNPMLDDYRGGELILGGVDTNRYSGQIYWQHMTSSNEWAIKLDKVAVGANHIGCLNGNCKAVLKTGINNILGPKHEIDNIYRALNARVEKGIPFVDCRYLNSMPQISFVFNGVQLAILPTNYVRKMKTGRIFKENTCYITFQASQGSQSEWVLGTSFLGAYYSIFDLTYKQVGFAALRL